MKPRRFLLNLSGLLFRLILLFGLTAPVFSEQEAKVVEIEAVKVWKGHAKGVVDFAFSPSGEYLVTSGLDGTVKLWDSSSGRILRTYTEHTDEVTASAFSYDGEWILSAGYDRRVCARRISGADVKILDDYKGWTSDIAPSPEHSEVAVWTMDGSIIIWDWIKDERVKTLEGERNKWGFAMAWAPGGKRLVSGRAALSIWDIETGQKLSVMEGHKDFVHDLAFSADGRLLASAGLDKSIKIWVFPGGELVQSLQPEGFLLYTDQGPVTNPIKVSMTAAAFSPDGRWLATGGADRLVRVWDTKNWIPVTILRGHRMTVTAIDFSPDGRWVAASGLDKTLRVWDLSESGPQPRRVAALPGKSEY